MFLQLVGALIVMLSCTIAGICFGKKINYRIEELEQMQSAMTMLQNQIHFLAIPLPEAMEEIGLKYDNIIGNLFLKTAKEMEKREEEKGEEIWKKVVLNWKEKTYLEKQDIDAILCFGCSMGYLDITQQKASISLLLQYIEMTLVQLQEKKKQQQKLYPSMGILGGMLIVVVLL